jgi:hypothetical protein
MPATPSPRPARPSTRLQMLLVMMRQQQQTYGKPGDRPLNG